MFVEQTGLPFKTYLLRLRLTKPLESFAGGASLTHAALCWGLDAHAPAQNSRITRQRRRLKFLSIPR